MLYEYGKDMHDFFGEILTAPVGYGRIIANLALCLAGYLTSHTKGMLVE